MQDKKEDPSKESDSRSTKSTSKKPESERGRREEKRIRTWDRDHRSHSRSRSRERRRRDDVLTFAKIRVNILIGDKIILGNARKKYKRQKNLKFLGRT